MSQNTQRVAELSDVTLSSAEIAALVGISRRYVSKIQLKKNLPRLPEGGRPGDKNHQFVCGRRIGRDGYVLVTADKDHLSARKRPHRQGRIIFEHRLVLENALGRYLLPGEVVDHIDGITLHNSVSNLRSFQTNADHLHATLLIHPTANSSLLSRCRHRCSPGRP